MADNGQTVEEPSIICVSARDLNCVVSDDTIYVLKTIINNQEARFIWCLSSPKHYITRTGNQDQLCVIMNYASRNIDSAVFSA